MQYPRQRAGAAAALHGQAQMNYLLTAFEHGIDGIIVAGCLEGGCHFLEGNLRARKRVERTKKLLAEIGLEPERVEMFNLSSAEGTRFAEIVSEMSGRLARLGKSPLRPDHETIQRNLQEMTDQAAAALAGVKHDCCRSQECA